MTDATLATHGDLSVLRFERRLEHPAERVWRAITDPDELRHWFPSAEELHVSESEAPSLLVGSWYGDTLRFRLSPDSGGCTLVFTHEFTEHQKAARDAAGWESCFARFDALLGGRTMGEAESMKDWPETHEHYAEKFGVDPAVGRGAFTEHRPET